LEFFKDKLDKEIREEEGFSKTPGDEEKGARIGIEIADI
jgi:hypothetical protein